MWIFIWIMIAIICGIAGKDRECGSFYGFGWALLCPPIGLIYVAFSKKKKTVVQALMEAEVFFKNGVISAGAYDEMRTDIVNGTIRDIQYYQKRMDQPLREKKQGLLKELADSTRFMVSGK